MVLPPSLAPGVTYFGDGRLRVADLTSARVLADSVSAAGARLTTFELVLPRFALAELNTHRALSRNSASSRARPVEKVLTEVRERPFVPQRFPINQKGMSASEYIEPGTDEYADCAQVWLHARDNAVNHAVWMLEQGVHKQIANRLLEPFMWHTVIASATSEAWDGFLLLRDAPDAQPEIQVLAAALRVAWTSSAPVHLDGGSWHLPLIGGECGTVGDTPPGSEPFGWAKISAGRCARVSYLTHEGKRDLLEDIALADRLQQSRHLSPFEHVAHPNINERDEANFKGWTQLRSYVERRLVPTHQ